MISLDVESMFPSIPIDRVIEQATNVLLNRTNNKLSRKSINQMFLFCTKEITFSFCWGFYKQNKGLSMGSPLAPVLANLYFSNI